MHGDVALGIVWGNGDACQVLFESGFGDGGIQVA